MIALSAALAGIGGPHEARVGDVVVLEAPEARVWWRRRVEPGRYDNAAYCGPPVPGCAQPLPVHWERVGEGPSLRLTAVPGTGHYAATTGAEPVDDTPTHSLAVRSDDSYVGYLDELLGVPFVFAPAWIEGGHQTDQGLATDCVALVVYGQRRLGRRVPYVSPYRLYELLEPARGAARVGDVLHWGWQTAVLAEDTPPLGRIDGTDVLVLAWRGEAERRTLGSLPFAGTPVAHLRWPESGSEPR